MAHEVSGSQINYHRARIAEANRRLGSERGKTFIVMACGPQVRRFNASLIARLASQKDVYLVGVNAIPAISTKMWKAKPAFHAMVAQDVCFDWALDEWGWSALPESCRRYTCRPWFDRNNFQLDRNPNGPSTSMFSTYQSNSVCAAINLCMMLGCTEYHEERVRKVTGVDDGEDHSIRIMDKAKCEIILVGLEMNRYNHAFSDNPDFTQPDDPAKDWPNLAQFIECHDTIEGFARQYDAVVLNAAPWSAIRSHRFVDFKEIDPSCGGISRPPATTVKASPYTFNERYNYWSELDNGRKPERPTVLCAH
jgi:hypothetical protein